MTILIAVDGHSLNLGLQKVAQKRNQNVKDYRPRFRIDHELLADFLLEIGETTSEKSSIRFYTDNEKLKEEPRAMGRVVKYFSAKGYGFISATDGNNYFFHNNDIVNKKALCNANEERYPHPTSREFQNRIMNKIVTLDATTGEDGRFRAEEVRLEFGARALDQFYRLRREPFLEMLEDCGYKVVRCRPSHSNGKSKGVDCRIYLDSLCDLEGDDTLVLLSDDPIFCELLQKLREFDINVTLVTFKTPHSEELRNAVEDNGGRVVLLDNHLDDLELAFDDEEDEDGEEDASVEEKALASN